MDIAKKREAREARLQKKREMLRAEQADAAADTDQSSEATTTNESAEEPTTKQ